MYLFILYQQIQPELLKRKEPFEEAGQTVFNLCNLLNLDTSNKNEETIGLSAQSWIMQRIINNCQK